MEDKCLKRIDSYSKTKNVIVNNRETFEAVRSRRIEQNQQREEQLKMMKEKVALLKQSNQEARIKLNEEIH